MMQSALTGPKQFTGKHMLAILVAFFGVVIAVNLLLAYYANSTWSGLVAANGYDASQSFNADERRARAQQAEGWTTRLTHQGDTITLVFTDRNAQPLSGLTISSSVGRPTTDVQDQKLSFHEASPGTYLANVRLATGIWDVNIDINGDGEQDYRKTYEIIVK
jgi:nitrogen fixation protein FixH